MIHKDIKVIDLGSDNWSRLMRLPTELAAAGAEESRMPRALLIVYRGLKVLKAIDVSERRAIEVEWQGTSRLEALSKTTGYPVVIALEETALARVFECAQRELDFRDDMVRQWSGFLRGVAMQWRRTIFTYPSGPSRIPVLPPAVLEAVVRALVPDNTLILFAVTDRGKVWTSAVLGFREREFWLLTSLDTIEMEEADIRGPQADHAVEKLETKFGGKVRAIVVERSELTRLFCSRFPLADMLWALNSGDLRRFNVPRRFKALMFTTLLLKSLRFKS